MPLAAIDDGIPKRPADTMPSGHWIRIARKSLTLVSVGPVTTCAPIAAKKLCASLLRQRQGGVDPAAPGAGQRVGADDRAGHLGRAIDAIGVAGHGMDARRAVQGQGQRQAEFGIRPARSRRRDG
jgi:hypothetical protein